MQLRCSRNVEINFDALHSMDSCSGKNTYKYCFSKGSEQWFCRNMLTKI